MKITAKNAPVSTNLEMVNLFGTFIQASTAKNIETEFLHEAKEFLRIPPRLCRGSGYCPLAATESILALAAVRYLPKSSKTKGAIWLRPTAGSPDFITIVYFPPLETL